MKRSAINAARKVYFIKPVGMDGPVKIGVSISPDYRRKTLDDWSPFALEIIAEVKGDHRAEQRFHAHFEHLHERREWFRPSAELSEVIDRIKSGTFDMSMITEKRICITGRWIGEPRAANMNKVSRADTLLGTDGKGDFVHDWRVSGR